MFPENLVQACFQSTTTYYVTRTPDFEVDDNMTLFTTVSPLTTAFNSSNITLAKSAEIFERRQKYIDGMNVLGSPSRHVRTSTRLNAA